MPELPEVENVVLGIQDVVGSKIISATKNIAKLRSTISADICGVIQDARISLVTRKAKYILIHLDNQYIILVHLGMSGKIRKIPSSEYSQIKHDHFLMYLESGLMLVYNDARRFGEIKLLKKKDLDLMHFGVEPLSDELTLEYFRNYTKKSKKPIKILLLEQKFISGIGNIYASEILFKAAVFPTSFAYSLSDERVLLLIDAIKLILKEAINRGGSTIRDYKNADNKSGSFQDILQVYGRENEECHICCSNIENMKLGGRSTFYCKKCQVF